jgi:lysozyme
MNDIDLCFEIFIKKFEGMKDLRADGLVYPYTCPAGFPTIGYGTLIKSLNEPPISVAQAEAQAKKDLATCKYQALKLSPGIEGPLLIVIMDFIYNLGPTAYASSTLRKCINYRRNTEQICDQLMRWTYGGKGKNRKQLKGLVRRREAERNFLRKS